MVKMAIKVLVKKIVTLTSKSKYGIRFIDFLVSQVINKTETVYHKGLKFVLSTPNGLNHYRADTFSTKEPETLEWIDNFQNNSVMWDIGANVGLYSCYAAKSKNCKVYSFEPSVFNLELLAKNIWLNDLTSNVSIVPMPLSDTIGFNKLNMSSVLWGGALSTFGETYGFDGEQLNTVFEFSVIGFTMNDSSKLLQIPMPEYIKIDVDGIEHLILKGGDEILKYAKSVLIEVDDNFEIQANQTSDLLKKCGLELIEKRHAEIYNQTTTFNQIWVRKY
jgi:FkbM family methyltransferase